MKLLTLLAVFFLAALLALPQGVCRVGVAQTGVNRVLKQVRLTVKVDTKCALGGRSVVRFRTERGGVLPLTGYTLRGSYPREYTSWLSDRPDVPGPFVEQKIAGQWKTVWRMGK